MALGELALIAGLAATLLWQSARGTIVPRMVQVDRLGEAQAGSPPPSPTSARPTRRSVEPPAGKVTVKRIGPVGQSDCPKAGAASSAPPKPKTPRRVVPLTCCPLFASQA